MATITSLGVGSGLDLTGLLDQLQDAERGKLAPITRQKEQQQAFRKSEAGLKEAERTLADGHFSPLDQRQLANVDELERQATTQLQQQLTTLRTTQSRVEKELVKAMSDAQREDRGALSEVGRELDDVPDYLARLKVLTEEALPDKQQRFQQYLTDSSDQGVSQLLATIEGEVERIEERLEDLNNTLRRVDFQRGRYLQLVANKVVHESLRTFTRANTALASSRFVEDGGESQYKALQYIIALLRDACERQAYADPLQRGQALVGQLPVQPERGEHRCGVDEHHDMSGRGMPYRFAHQQELQRKTEAGQAAQPPHAVRHGEPLVTPEHQNRDQQCGNTGTQGDLQHGGAIRGGRFQDDLLQAPDQAEHQHQADGHRVQGFTGIHQIVSLRGPTPAGDRPWIGVAIPVGRIVAVTAVVIWRTAGPYP